MAFWKPGAAAPGSVHDRESERETAVGISRSYAASGASSLSQRGELPIAKSRDQLLYLVDRFKTIILVGHTGSGKTTQVPQFLFEAGWAADGRVIACTQPRRVAATSVAERVADEMGVELGQEVGYTIRFEDKSHQVKTRIKYMTDGMLFRETLLDPLLSKYSVIMLDEAHERGLYTDILMGLLKKIRKKRPSLRIIISSATLDAEAFMNFFQSTDETTGEKTATIISLEGRMFPVDIHYLEEPCQDYVEQAIQTVFDIHVKEPLGDILVFMTGREDIETVVQELTERATTLPSRALQLLPIPFYAGLPQEEQQAIFDPAPYNTRRVVVSTNIAEASITLQGVVFVIDSGFVKLRAYNPKTGMESLTTTSISQASGQQRAGRAGRVKPGKAYRLYTEEQFERMLPASIPEMQRSNLAPVILQLKALGIENVLLFEFMTPPPAQLMIRALELLYSLKALDENGRLTTPLGLQLAEFPVDPMVGKILLDSHDFGCSEEMLTIAAMTSIQNVFITPNGAIREAEAMRQKFAVEEGDHLTMLNVYNAFNKNGQNAKWCHKHLLNYKALVRASSVRSQLKRYITKFDVSIQPSKRGNKSNGGSDTTQIRKCLVSGFFSQAAKARPDGTFETIRDGVLLHIHPSSVLFKRNPQWVIFHEVIETTKPFMRDLTVIESSWLAELAPHFYQSTAPVLPKHR